ncbi:hypothetical protein NN561_000422 [Cricetulus griseus]
MAEPVGASWGRRRGRPRGAQGSRFPQTPPASGAAAALPWQPRPAGARFQAPALQAGRGGAGVARRPAAGVRLRGAVSRLPPFTYFSLAETEVGEGWATTWWPRVSGLLPSSEGTPSRPT